MADKLPERIHSRCTAEEKRNLDIYLARNRQTLTDWIRKCIKALPKGGK